MKHSVNLSILLAIAISGFATAIPESKQSAWQKTKSFLQRHKKKIVAGVAAATAIGVALGLGYHADKTMKAIEKVGIQPSDEEFEAAVAAVGLLGPLGKQRAINIILKAKDRGILSTEQATMLVITNVGAALAVYWGISHAKFMKDAGFQATKRKIKTGWKALKTAISNLV